MAEKIIWYNVHTLAPKHDVLVEGSDRYGEYKIQGFISFDKALNTYKLVTPDKTLSLYDVKYWRFI